MMFRIGHPRTPDPVKRVSWRESDPLDLDARLLDQVEALVTSVCGPVVDLRHAGVDHELRAQDARLRRHEHDLLRVVHADLDPGVLFPMDAAAAARLID